MRRHHLILTLVALSGLVLGASRASAERVEFDLRDIPDHPWAKPYFLTEGKHVDGVFYDHIPVDDPRRPTVMWWTSDLASVGYDAASRTWTLTDKRGRTYQEQNLSVHEPLARQTYRLSPETAQAAIDGVKHARDHLYPFHFEIDPAAASPLTAVARIDDSSVRVRYPLHELLHVGWDPRRETWRLTPRRSNAFPCRDVTIEENGRPVCRFNELAPAALIARLGEGGVAFTRVRLPEAERPLGVQEELRFSVRDAHVPFLPELRGDGQYVPVEHLASLRFDAPANGWVARYRSGNEARLPRTFTLWTSGGTMTVGPGKLPAALGLLRSYGVTATRTAR
ncbi:MAG: hypothetical protein IT371_28445 [Deltaproteobacteria bacterium]|nr:hypothetical protein [Deltaproteobacteria bacterium]